MAYNRVGLPTFFLDAALLARQWGQIETENPEGKYYLNPSKVTNIELDVGLGGYAKDISIEFKKRYWCNSITHLFLLGHNFKTDGLQLLPFIIEGDNLEGYISLEPTVNGWNKHNLVQITNLNVNTFMCKIATATGSVLETTETLLGDISIGWSWTPQHSPQLELTQSFSNESIKTQTTLGGHTLSNAGYNHQPSWIRQPWTGTNQATTSVDRMIAPTGRRSWNLKFSYLTDDDTDSPLFAETYNSANGIFEWLGETEDNPETAEELDESGDYMYGIKKDFMSRVYHGSNGFMLPFIFTPNKNAVDANGNSNVEYAICRINNDTASFNQVANNVYDISLDIVEVW